MAIANDAADCNDRPMEEMLKLTAGTLGTVPHGFLGRSGGLSDGIYASLNVGTGSDDDADAVARNRARAGSAIVPNGQLCSVYQIHSAIAVPVTDAFTADSRPHADAMATDRPGMLLGILTADCVPVLFADRAAGIVGAAHAGWKGAISGVTDATIAQMEMLGADRDNINAAIGPCIAQKSYEVDEGFFKRFAEDDAENERFFALGKTKDSGQHYQFDIEGYVAARLAAAGIGKVECLGEDTYSQPGRFFSYRRSCHNDEPDYGRQISIIGLPE